MFLQFLTTLTFNRMKKILYILLIASIFTIYSCEDKIDLDLDTGRTQLVIDAFVSSDSTLQTIRVTQTASYFLNSPTPGVSNAAVSIEGPNNTIYNFSHNSNGNYTYDPSTNGRIDSIGYEYKLKITANNKDYMSVSTLNPSPVIDSITYNFEEEEPGAEEGYYAQFWSRDFAGRRDWYWIKAFKNKDPIDTASYAQYNLSQDAAFSGDAADGFIFIVPIRAGITNEDEPFIIGDSVSVELISINEVVWNYLIQVSTQANNGGLFATPTANIRTNITDIAGQVQNDVLGVFSMSSISRNSIIIE